MILETRRLGDLWIMKPALALNAAAVRIAELPSDLSTGSMFHYCSSVIL